MQTVAWLQMRLFQIFTVPGNLRTSVNRIAKLGSSHGWGDGYRDDIEEVSINSEPTDNLSPLLDYETWSCRQLVAFMHARPQIKHNWHQRCL